MPALLTVFPVILCVAEAIGGEALGIKDLFRLFIHEMDDKSSWIIPPTSGALFEDTIAKKLADLRNALNHALSKQSGILWLQGTMQARELFPEGRPDSYLLGVIEFVAAVKKTVDKLILSHPDAVVDPEPRGPDRQIPKPYSISARKQQLG